MAKKDHKEIDLENFPSVSELNDYIEEVDGKINNLMMRVNSAKGDDKVKALKVRIGAMKKTQEDVKQRFNDFIMKNCQHDNQGNLEMNKSFEDVKVRIQEFMKEEDNVNERLKQLMMIQFDKSDDLDKDSGGWTVFKGEYNVNERLKELMMIKSDKSDDLDKDSGVWTVIKCQEQCVDDAASGEEKFEKRDISVLKIEELGTPGIKIQEDCFKNEEAPALDRSGPSSVVDFGKITDSASSDDLGGGANNEVLEQKMRELVLARKDLLNIDEDDLKKRVMDCVKELGNTRKI